MRDLLSLADPIEAISDAMPGAAVYQRFEREPDVLAIAVVDPMGRPVGIVERNSFFLKMAAEYGRALYAQRPVSVLMNARPLIVDGAVSQADFTQQVLAERPSELLQGFVVVQDGTYFGVGSALSLLQAASRANKAHAEEMTELAGTLQVAQSEARAALKAKSQFLAVMSHEIRTPLNGVLALAEVLDRRLNQEELKPYAHTILDSGKTLLRLLTDALDLSRAEAGQLDLVFAPFNLPAIVEDIRNLWSARAGERGLTLSVLYDGPDDLQVVGDEVRLKQVLNNLVGNALKFTDAGEVALRLEARRDAGGVHLAAEVSDTGPGVPEALLETIFQPFAQHEGGRAKGGAGLGLSICREIVTRMGGTITARLHPAGGLVIAFDGALEAADQTPVAHLAGAPNGGIGTLGLRVLIADDNATNRLVAETLCSLFDCACQSVEDGRQAVEAALTSTFDLVLMDIKMPVMDGLEATRMIRGAGGAAATLPILALTANADPGDAALYLSAGMDGVVEKPIKPAALLEAMAQAMRKAAPGAGARAA